MDTTRDHALAPHRDTRDRLIEAITAHGPVTARELADRFGLTSAAVRRHLAVLESEGVIQEHDVPVASRGRGRPSKSFVIAARAHATPDEEHHALARLALEELSRLGGATAIETLAARRAERWAEELEAEVAVAEQRGETIDVQRRVEMLAAILTAHGYATTVRPLTVTVPTAVSLAGARPRTVVTAQLCQGHCPVQEVAAEHPELCEVETRVISRILGVPVQRLATLAGGAHACTTHIPLTEGRDTP
ncbi:MAG: winged helix-turn-helix transcriptional regulator [Brachybacterium sp.]|nr:winged helix-turn-helix transcriptional regulator [Brachybacterium sp.]